MTTTTWRNAGAAIVLALLLAGCPGDPAAGNAATADAKAPPKAVEPANVESMPEWRDPVPAPAAEADADVHAGMDRPGSALPPPSIAVGEPNPGAPGVVDASCRTDADCAIKDVGSCCGAHPACVNAASPTFPDRVKAQCAQDGRVSTCGFPAITGCQCTAGRCEGTGAGAGDRIQ